MVHKVLIILAACLNVSLCFSDIGKWTLPMTGDNCGFSLTKSLYKDSQLFIELHCDVVETRNITITVQWLPTPCSPDYFHYFGQQIVECPSNIPDYTVQKGNDSLEYKDVIVVECHRNRIFIEDLKNKNNVQPPKSALTATSKGPPLLTVRRAGVYMLSVRVWSARPVSAVARVEMLAPSGYLSASIWPLLPFFGTLCGVYTLLVAAWLAVCAAQWRDLLRIQYWIGGVALLGMLESATYYSVYSSINNNGTFNTAAYIFAEWVSVAKRTLARMLVIIVSLGFGIVKPRLGPALQRVLAVGLTWGALACVEAYMRLQHKADDSNRSLLLSEAPLSLVDSAVCWWVFVSLAHTMRTLQLRRNTVKLSLYRHFTNTLIFAVISSVIFMLYSIKSYRVLDCIMNWEEVWMDEAYWHLLFASVLCVIMVLWRPTNNNQRYAFTPLLDHADDDDDEEEQFVNDAYGVKMRGTSISDPNDTKESALPEPNTTSLDSDLRWVEENIPSSSLPLLDSDEEIINTKFEVSKMQ